MNTINYSNIQKTVQFFEDRGYKNIEVPWRITKPILELTAPDESHEYMIDNSDKGLLASGEQGFLYLVNKGFLPEGSYVTTTPCFRNDSHDVTHSKQFLKTELFFFDTIFIDNEQFLEGMVQDAKQNFAKISNRKIEEFYTVATPAHKASENVDIMFNGIELGSYGIRSNSVCTYVYGTAIAEPRFSKTMRLT